MSDNTMDTVNQVTDEQSKVMESVKQIIITKLNIKDEQLKASINGKTKLTDLGADSLDSVDVVMALEDEFDLEIPDSEASAFGSVEDIVNFVHAELKKKDEVA